MGKSTLIRPAMAVALAAATLLLCPALAAASNGASTFGNHVQPINIIWGLPFVLLLGCIALMPFIHKHGWEKYYPAVSIGLGAVAAFYYFRISPTGASRWISGMEDYISFIILLGSLFIVSGGIVIHVGRKNTPVMNTVLLGFGAVIANIFGTTGASMLLIRPYLRMNKGFLRPFHIVFFIFIVSNAGGLLTPVGDPPLFLGYLKGVPFWWVLEKCRLMWLTAVGLLLLIFYIIDRLDHAKEERTRDENDLGPPVFIHGIHNALFILVILWSVFRPGLFEAIRVIHETGWNSATLGQLILSREILMIVAAVGSTVLTSRRIYQHNEFTYGPIKEVAILFVGIFSTMVPALQWLNENARNLHVETPGQFYFASGTLSSFLDNAPTYLTFLEVEIGKLDEKQVDQAQAIVREMHKTKKYDVDKSLPAPVQKAVAATVAYHQNAIEDDTVTRDQVRVAFLLGDDTLARYIMAISLGSVLFGACTYIGNGPNFMVKSIADAAGCKTPSFIGYIFRYTIPILLPVYILVWALYLR